MRESCQIVRIEKHRVGDIACLTFADEAAGPVRRPLVFVVHGLLSRKERHTELCLALAGAGFLACTLDVRHHGERATPEVMSLLAGQISEPFLAAFLDAVAGTVADISVLAAYFEAQRYGIIGHSMGGYIAFKATTSDPRVAVLVSISGNPDWTVLPEGTTLPADALNLARAESPLTHAERFWPRPLLMLHGDADYTVPITGVRRLHASLLPRYADAPERLRVIEYPGAGHEFLPDMATQAVAWMEAYLSNDGG